MFSFLSTNLHVNEPVEEEENIALAGIIIVTFLIGISIIFELATEKLKEETDEMNAPFIHTVFSELTTLGFIGLILFVVSKLDMLSSISLAYLGEETKLQETIEMLHMILFMFVLIFLSLCCGLLKFGLSVQEEWRQFERRASDENNVIRDYVLNTEPFITILDWCNINKVKNMYKSKREMTYVALRRRFVEKNKGNHHPDPNSKVLPEYQSNPNFRFPFNEYLSIISGEVMGRLIEIDVPTWCTLYIIIVLVWTVSLFCGPTAERFIFLGAGGFLILLNQFVYTRIDTMRHLLTPQLLYKKADILRHRKKWRSKHGLVHLDQSSSEDTPLCHKIQLSLKDEDYIPYYVQQLPNYGLGMTDAELMKSQKALLGGRGNGVLLALFSTRMVFLLTAMHLSVFIVRGANDIYNAHSSHIVIFILYFCMLLPSILVVYMATRIARDGLYAFNVEHMKVPRVITKVMRILKARQTLRTLRFVAEMKVYLREDERRASIITFPTVEELMSGRPTSPTDTVLSPRTIESSHEQHKRIDDAYEIEQERREINVIFCLFDVDGSGSVSRDEMQSLLLSITHDVNEMQISRIMKELHADAHEEVSFETFYNWCHDRIRKCQHTKTQLIQEVFNMVDTDSSGEITVDEFIAIFRTLGQSLDHDDVRELVYQMDTNDDGKINLEEFSKMIRKHAI